MKNFTQIKSSLKKSTQLCCFATAIFFGQYLKAQTMSQIMDIRTGSMSSTPQLLTYCGAISAIFFVADNGVNGQELWKYDISTSTATMVADINPGATGSGITAMIANTSANGVIFNANDGTAGNELWKSDGTQAGTSLITDINTGTASSNPGNFVINANVVIFSADNGTNGKELWRTNGNQAGTIMVKDINPGSNSADPNNIVPYAGKVFFRAGDGTNGTELWVSDLTVGGTTMVKDINTGSLSSIPMNLAVAGNTLFFSATDATNGFELWSSDGTGAGTNLLKDINAGAPSSMNLGPGARAWFTAFNNILYFQASDGATGYELWKSDGSLAGTTLVKDIQTGSSSSSPSQIFATPGLMYMVANDGTDGVEVWISNGTTGGTALLKDIAAGATPGASLTAQFVRSGNGDVYFAADNASNGLEIWQSQGTASTTTMLYDLNSGAGSGTPANMLIVNNIIYFAGNDGITGQELWKYDPNPPTGIAVNVKKNNFNLYPNPSEGKIYFEGLSAGSVIEVYNSAGQLLSSHMCSGEDLQMDCTKDLPGIYFFRISSIDQSEIRKVIISK